MESGTVRTSVDWMGRAIALVSLLVACGTVAYLAVLQQQNANNPDAAVESLDGKLADVAEKYEKAQADLAARYAASLERQDARLEGWNTQLNDALLAFQTDANSLLNKWDQNEQLAISQRQTAFRQTLAGISAAGQNTDDEGVRHAQAEIAEDREAGLLNAPANATSAVTATEDNDPDTTADTNPFLDDELFNDNSSGIAGAELKLVNTVLRPGTGNTTLIEVQNTGSEDALIMRIRFRPESDFENADPLELDPQVVNRDVQTLAYSPDDNTSPRPGFHGVYDRNLSQPIRVPAGQQATLRVVIENAEHEGWGFVGKMIIDYNDQQRVVVDTARVAFRKI